MSKRNLPIRTSSPTVRRIFEIIKEKELSQANIANACHTSQGMLSCYRTGRTEPGVFTVEEIAAYLGYKIELVPIDNQQDEEII